MKKKDVYQITIELKNHALYILVTCSLRYHCNLIVKFNVLNDIYFKISHQHYGTLFDYQKRAVLRKIKHNITLASSKTIQEFLSYNENM